MDSLRWRAFVALGVWGVGLTGCADPCLDDGLGQSDCPTADTEGDTDEGSSSASESMTASESLTASMTESESMSASNSMSASDSADSTDATDTDTDTESVTDTESATSASSEGGGPLWCVDADGDGFGDPDDCTNTDDPPDGTVDNDDDCDDDDDHAFPGAAENEPNGGDAECMQDADEDGWGDANPDDDGTVAGADCYDGNVALNPDTMALSTFLTSAFGNSYIIQVDETSGGLGNVIPIDSNGFDWDPVSATIAEDGTLIVVDNSDDRLWAVDWATYCADDPPAAEAEPLPMDTDFDVFCGVAFGPDGVLYGIESETDTIAVLDPASGAVVSSVSVTLDGNPYDVGSCGMTFDCHTQQLVFAAGFEGAIYSVDPVSGALELLVDIDGTWTPTGLGYDPVDRVVHLAANTELFRIALDGSAIDDLGPFTYGFGDASVSNLDQMPTCSP
jgi:hypothetical protein